MTYRVFSALIAIQLLMSGCTLVKVNYNSEEINILEPQLDTVSIAYVGDELLRRGKYRLHDAIILKDGITVGGLGKYTLYPGEYVKRGDDRKAEYYKVGQTENPGRIKRCALCDPSISVMAYRDEPKLCAVTIFGVKVCGNDILFERKQIPIVAADSYQQALIYIEKIGDKVKLGYRAFSKNLARPELNDDIEYDLSKSRTIDYKGAQLQIIEATNEYIKYRTIRNFNSAATQDGV